MPKIIIENKNINSSPLKLKIDDVETGSVLNKNIIENEISYGEHTVQMYGNFIARSVKKMINVDKNELKFKLTLNYKLWGSIFLVQVIMMLLVLKFPQKSIFVITPTVIAEFLCIIAFGMLDLKEI